MANIMRLGGGSGGGKPKKLLSSLTEGSLVSVLEDGKLVPFYVAKHNYEADLNGEGRTLLVRKNLHSWDTWDSNKKNAYIGSTIDTWLNNDYFNMLSTAVRANCGSTTIEYTQNNNASTVLKSVFLLSTTELGVSSGENKVEGETLPIASTLRIAMLDGVAKTQWVRTPTPNSTDLVDVVTESGAYAVDYANGKQGRRPCFTLPANMVLNEAPNADGTWTLADEVTIDVETASTTAKAGVNYTNGITDLTPAQLHEIAAAISSNPNINKYMGTIYYDKGDVHRKISAGDSASIQVGTVANTVTILGFNHDDLALGTVYGIPTATGKAGLSFQAIMTSATGWGMNPSNTTVGGWESSVMRKEYLPSALALFPNELRNVIKAINKVANSGNGSTGLKTVSDNITVPSEIEVFGSRSYSAAGEGEQYAYYKAGNSKILYNTSGKAIDWWLRSSSITAGSYFCAVNTLGNATQYSASTSIAAAFIYCI